MFTPKDGPHFSVASPIATRSAARILVNSRPNRMDTDRQLSSSDTDKEFHCPMTITNTPTRSFLHDRSWPWPFRSLLATPAVMRAANPGQAAQETGKDKEKGKKKTMTKTESGLKYRRHQGRHRRASRRGSYRRRALHRLALGQNMPRARSPLTARLTAVSPSRFTWAIGEVIKGWDEGVSSMKMKGKRRAGDPARPGLR